MSPTSSDTPEAARVAPPAVPWRHAPPLLALYAGAVTILSWPWLATFRTHVANHWDPPFHAWKLMFAARALLAGRILPPDGNTNLYYPHSGAFFYEALHWPQAVFAAPLLAAGVSPTATYHITLLFFWALSGVIFWAWLRAMGARPLGAALGGLFFSVIPYRMSYLVEFNMQLVFGLPLLLFALTRFFQQPGFRYALLAAVAWWLQATSELYQAIFVVLAFPFIVLPLVARDASLLRSWRRLWLPLAAAIAVCSALSLPFLLPYAKTLGDGTLSRSLTEMQSHALEPLSYLRPWGWFQLLPTPNAKQGEMSVYPTAALALAALIALCRRAKSPLYGSCRLSKRLFAVAIALFAALSLLTFLTPPPIRAAHATAISWTGLAVVLLSVPILLEKRRSVQCAMAAGLGAAAVFGIVMSLGPDIFIRNLQVPAHNVLFRQIRALVPGLAGFRVVSRFSVFPMMALCLAGAFAVDDAATALRRRPMLASMCLVLFLALFVAECVPKAPTPKRPIRDVSHSAAIAALDAMDAQGSPYVLAIVPMGNRNLDSEHMLTIERDDRLGVWAWGGTYPRWTTLVSRALDSQRGTPERAAALLRQVWPEILVLEDRRPFAGISSHNYAKWFGPLAKTIAADGEFRLMRLAAPVNEELEAIRLVRRDFAVARPVARFSLSASAGSARVWLDLNGRPIGVWDVAATPIECATCIPESLLVDRLPERFRFHAEGDVPFRLEGFQLEASSNCSLTPPPAAAPDLPWLGTSKKLPAGATKLDVRYPGGVSLCGAKMRPETERNGHIPLRLYLRFPKDTRKIPPLTLSLGFLQSGKVIFQHQTSLREAVDANAFGFADGEIVAADVDVFIPDLVLPGVEYGLTFDLWNAAGRRMNGRDEGNRKVRHVPIGLNWVQ